MTAKHTPTLLPSAPPWKIVTEGFKRGFASIETEDGGYEVVLSCRHDNAAFIVKAVNCHDALVEALETVLNSSPCNQKALKVANAALSKARRKRP